MEMLCQAERERDKRKSFVKNRERERDKKTLCQKQRKKGKKREGDGKRERGELQKEIVCQKHIHPHINTDMHALACMHKVCQIV